MKQAFHVGDDGKHPISYTYAPSSNVLMWTEGENGGHVDGA